MRYDGKRGLWWIFTLVFYNLAIVWSVVEREKYNGFVVCLIATFDRRCIFTGSKC